MRPSLLHEPDELITTPHLSHSRISRYLTCPEQYRLYYVEGLRPRVPSANLAFGSAIHGSLAQMFSAKADPLIVFGELWGEAKETPLAFSNRDSWESLREKGERMLTRFVAEELPKLGTVSASERPFELAISNLDVPFVGIIDLFVDLGGRKTVVDFKTGATALEEHEAALSDQLTAYQLAEPLAEQSALCVFVKTKEPRIDWLLTRRTPEQLLDYLRKTELIGREIAAGHFYRRPGKHCSWCDFLPVCLGDRTRAEETLIQTMT